MGNLTQKDVDDMTEFLISGEYNGERVFPEINEEIESLIAEGIEEGRRSDTIDDMIDDITFNESKNNKSEWLQRPIADMPAFLNIVNDDIKNGVLDELVKIVERHKAVIDRIKNDMHAVIGNINHDKDVTANIGEMFVAIFNTVYGITVPEISSTPAGVLEFNWPDLNMSVGTGSAEKWSVWIKIVGCGSDITIIGKEEREANRLIQLLLKEYAVPETFKFVYDSINK